MPLPQTLLNFIDDNTPGLGFIDAETNKGDENAEMQLQRMNDETVKLQIGLSCTVASTNPSIVTHGATIALQPLYQKLMWLGCAGNPCGKAGCPRLFMEGDDWNRCWGEVFQIYRASGPGSVKVGDVVGIYFPRGRAWFAMSGGRGHKEGCPGAPSTRYGFATQDKWRQCWGEVFQIYAKGKSVGDPIQNHDAVTIYYIHEKTWVGLVQNHPDRRGCPGQARPPPLDKYDGCWGEIFELWLR